MFASIRDVTLMEGGFESLAEGLKAVGLDAVELEYRRDFTLRNPTTEANRATAKSADEIADYAACLQDRGIRASAILLSNDFNAKDLDAELAWMEHAIRVSAALGCEATRVDAIMSGEREMPVRERAERAADRLRHLVEATSDLSVPLGIENHGACGNDPAFLDGVLRSVGHPRVGLSLDVANLYWWGTPLSDLYPLYERFAPRVVHVHLKNIQYPEADRERRREIGWRYGEFASPLSDGDIDLRRLADVLGAAGYSGDLCIEDESLGRFDAAGRVRVLRGDAEHALSLVR